MAAAGASLEFKDGSVWRADIARLAVDGLEERLKLAVMNAVINHRDSYGLLDLASSPGPSQPKGPMITFILYFRRREFPDRVNLLAVKEEPFTDDERTYWAEKSHILDGGRK